MPDKPEKTQIEANAEVASKLLEQDNIARHTSAEDLSHTSDALDALAAAKTKEKEAEAIEVAEKKDEVVPEKEKPKTAVEVAPVVAPAPDPAIEANKKRADEIFKDSPALPSNASPKSTEAFSSIKIKAAQEISARETELEQVKKERDELASKLKDPIPDDLKKELDDHRNWRAKLDVETDPKFKAFDKTVTEAQEFIYAQLRKSPAVTSEVIERIKSHGGPENVQLEAIFDAIKDPTIKLLVETKVADIEMAKFRKDQAIKSARENVNEYLTDRQKQWDESATAHNKFTQKEMEGLKATHLTWLAERQPDPKGADKAEVESHNKFVKEVQDHLKATLEDDSPRMRAIMMVGMAQLLYAQRAIPALKSAAETEKTAHDATKKQLTEVTEKYEKLKNGSKSRLSESAAPPGGKLPETKKDVDLRSAGEALDDLAKQVVEERRARLG